MYNMSCRTLLYKPTFHSFTNTMILDLYQMLLFHGKMVKCHSEHAEHADLRVFCWRPPLQLFPNHSTFPCVFQDRPFHHMTHPLYVHSYRWKQLKVSSTVSTKLCGFNMQNNWKTFGLVTFLINSKVKGYFGYTQCFVININWTA